MATLASWRWLAGVTLVLVLALIPFSTYVAAIPVITQEWGMNNTETGVVFSAFLVGYVASSLLVVPLTDRYPGPWVFLASSVVAGLSSVLFPVVADGPVSAALLRAIYGAGVMGVYVPGTRIVSEQFSGARRGRAVGFYVTGFYLATSVSLIISGVLLAELSWRATYVLMGASSVFGPALGYLLMRHVRRRQRPDRPAGGLNIRALQSKGVGLVILSYSLHAWELYIMRMWLAPFLVAVLLARGYADESAATTGVTAAGVIMALGAVGPFLGGLLSDRTGRTAAAGLIFAVSGASSFTLGWMLGAPWLLVLAVAFVYSFFVGFDSSVYTTAVTELANQRLLGSTLALHSFSGFGAGLLAPIAFGAIRDVSSDPVGWGLGFATGGFAALVSVGAILRLRTMPESRRMARGRR